MASETYLGRPFTTPPAAALLEQNRQDVNTILKKFLKNLHRQAQSGTRLCLAVPTWHTKNGWIHLALLDQLTDMGYNRVALKHVSFDDLLYAREGQIVGRELLILERV